MKKKFISIVLIGLISASLVSCSSVKNAIEEKKSKSTAAETDNSKVQDNSKTDSSVQDNSKTDSSSSESETGIKDSDWTYFNGTTWTDDFNGLQTTIEKVVTTDKAPADDGSNKIGSAVGVRFKIKNTTTGKFTTYPGTAVLVTSTGEQIECSTRGDLRDGEIDEGVTKEGSLVWDLKNAGTAKDITWIKLSWETYQGDENNIDGPKKEYEIKLPLKK